MPEPEIAEPRNPEPAPGATLRLTAGSPDDPFSTQRLGQPLGGDPPIRIQKSDPPVEAAGRTQKMTLEPVAPSPIGWKLPLTLGSLVVLGAAAYLVLSRGPVPPPPPTPAATGPDAIPAGAQVYLDQAKAGDAHAMRMLGVMYYYGLNVPQDREKGLYWYRKAAEQGSDAARAELGRLEGSSK